jgi:hypothetical protein
MKSGRAKTVLFATIPLIIQETGADGFLFATDMSAARITDEGKKHEEEIRANVDSGFESLVKLGWVVREEAIQVIAQTEQDVVMMTHAYRRRRGGVEWLGAEVRVGPQKGFDGRMKMFGCEEPGVTLGEPPKGSHADKHNQGEREWSN